MSFLWDDCDLELNIMKTIILVLFLVTTFVNAKMFAHGSGFFPVMVQVFHVDSGTPIKGAKVSLEGLPAYKESELDPNRQTKVLPDTLGKTVATNAEGVAVVFYSGGWASTTDGDKTIYSRALLGTVVVEHNGKEIFRSSLKEWAEKNDYKPDPSSVPCIYVSLPAAK
jgi:hypothetical protein